MRLIFTGAELSGSLMLRSDESAVILTDEQRMGICWGGGMKGMRSMELFCDRL